MKKLLIVTMAIIASLLMVSCNNEGGNVPTDKTSVKLWPAYDETSSKWGYINAEGKWAISAQYTSAHEFSGNYALVEYAGVQEFISANGARVSNVAPFDDCSGKFHNGYMPFKRSSYYGLFNSQLGIQIDPYYAYIDEMGDNGLVCVRKNPGEKCGYVDKDKKQRIEAIFDKAWPFVNDAAVIMRGNQYGVINTSGNSVVDLGKYDELHSVGANRIVYVSDQRQRVGLISTSGTEIGAPMYKAIDMFADNNLARFWDENEKMGYMDNNANELNLPNGRAFNATSFSEGKAFVRYVEGGDYEVIDTRAHKLFSLKKGEVPYGSFTNGLCLVWSMIDKNKCMYRYINTKGETIREWMGTKSVGLPACEAEDIPEYTENISQVRFRKEDAYTHVRELRIVREEDGTATTLAGYDFGEDAGTSSYYDIPSGSFTPIFYYVANTEELSGWYLALDDERTYNFATNKKYTFSCGDDGTDYVFTITLDGTANAPAKVVAQRRILKSEIVKEKMLRTSRH